MKKEFDFEKYIQRQIAWSQRTFGSSVRTIGLCKHIAKELDEIRSAPHDLTEWVDVMILAIDGAWRAGYSPEEIARGLKMKQGINFERQWPKNSRDDEPTEHLEETQCL